MPSFRNSSTGRFKQEKPAKRESGSSDLDEQLLEQIDNIDQIANLEKSKGEAIVDPSIVMTHNISKPMYRDLVDYKKQNIAATKSNENERLTGDKDPELN